MVHLGRRPLPPNRPYHWPPNYHYYQSGVQFTSLNHYGTLKSEITSLHFTNFTLVKVISL